MIIHYAFNRAQKLGAGISLVNPDSNEWKYKLSFVFVVSNNAVEYETIIVGLELVEKLGAQKLHVHANSQLKVKQIQGEYEVKDPILSKYYSIIIQLLQAFSEVQVDEVIQFANIKLESLSRMASAVGIRKRGKILLEHKEIPSYEKV